ncbi:MAG: hypothetical protein HFH93_12790 [Lachnospiraceae bacterium]|nr:hypothetical protein [Lachnospiraceae bacterium]
MRGMKKTACMAAVALALVAGACAGSARAYFTTFATAKGGHQITVDTKSQITEQFSDWTKRIRLDNTGTAECYVRVRVFAGSTYGLEYAGSPGWRDGGDGYWYYDEILPAGGSTGTLDVKITLPTVTVEDPALETPPPYTEDFNVVVIQECTAVLYTEDGVPYADWDAKLITDSDSYDREGGGAHE